MGERIGKAVHEEGKDDFYSAIFDGIQLDKLEFSMHSLSDRQQLSKSYFLFKVDIFQGKV